MLHKSMSPGLAESEVRSNPEQVLKANGTRISPLLFEPILVREQQCASQLEYEAEKVQFGDEVKQVQL